MGNGDVREQTPAFRVPEKNLAIFGTTPRLYHRKGEGLVRGTGKDCRTCHEPRYYPQQEFFGWEWQRKWTLHWWMWATAPGK